jgi:hypothetical protein
MLSREAKFHFTEVTEKQKNSTESQKYIDIIKKSKEKRKTLYML